MFYDALSWLAIALLIIGVGGLVASIMMGISTSMSKLALNGLRGVFLLCGVVGALGIGALVLGIFPGGHSEHASQTGVNATGKNGILTQGEKPANSSGQ